MTGEEQTKKLKDIGREERVQILHSLAGKQPKASMQNSYSQSMFNSPPSKKANAALLKTPNVNDIQNMSRDEKI